MTDPLAPFRALLDEWEHDEPGNGMLAVMGLRKALKEAEDADDRLAERCYRPGCGEWVTGASDYCSASCQDAAERPHCGGQSTGCVQDGETEYDGTTTMWIDHGPTCPARGQA